MPAVPFELHELVIKMLEDSDYKLFTATLRSCALTCHAWLPPSRRRLYHRIALQATRRTQLDALLETINANPDVSRTIQELFVQAVASPTRDVNYLYAQAILLVLARKLPRLATLKLIGGNTHISSSPAHLPILAGFPALTTLELHHVTFTSYGALQRMLAASPRLRRLVVANVTWKSTTVPPSVQYFPLRCPLLAHVTWYSYQPSEQDCLPLSYMIRDLNACASLEHLHLPSLPEPFMHQLVYRIAEDPQLSAIDLCHLSTLRLKLYYRKETLEDDTLGLKSAVQLISSLWSSRTHARPQRRFELSFCYWRGALRPVQNAEPQDVLERILWALKEVSVELERMLAAPGWGWLGRATFVFEDIWDHQDFSQETIRDFIVSLRSNVAEIFPELQRRGLLSVEFKSRRPRDHSCCDWVEDSHRDFRSMPGQYAYSGFE